MNIKQARQVHFTGIKGVGLTSVALCVRDFGAKITGSDLAEEFVTDEVLKRNGISWNICFDKKHLDPKPDILVYTGAHGGINNPEVVAAKEMGIPVLSHFEALAQLAEGKVLIAVAGVGGKTTTAAMIATVLDHTGQNPSYAIGVADIFSLPNPGRYTDSKYFVTEADEYAISPGIDNRPKFSLLTPKYLVVTNIKHDHPDIYPTPEDTVKVFAEFIEKVQSSGGIVFQGNENHLPSVFKLSVPGKFNINNANFAYRVCQKLGLPAEIILEGLKKYTGCKRRFEKVAEKSGILFYDDYAHHPIQIQETLKAVRQSFPNKRIVVIFQPHTYSRTKALFSEFAKSFNDADMVGISDIFASAREEKDPEVSSEKLVDEIKKYHPHPEHVGYLGNLENAAKISKIVLKKDDLFITLGAGDIYKIHDSLVTMF